MKSMGRYKCQGIVSTLSVIILVFCMVSNNESYVLGRVWGRQVCPEKSGTGTCTLRIHIRVESVKQSFSIMIFVPVVEHAPTLTVCLSLTNFKEPIRQKDLWSFWFDKSLWKLSWVLHKIHTWNCELLCFISYYPSLVSNVRNVRLIWSNLWMIVWWKIMVLNYIWWHFVKEQLNN